MNLSANWIWSDATDGRGYNLCSVFRREFRLEELPAAARLAVTADSIYRLKVNGQWIGDGPARAYPEHYRYDLIDVDGILRRGVNQIEVTVRYYGSGSFHLFPQRAGMLAQLDLTAPDGSTTTIVTDENWQAARVPQWKEHVPKISVQQCPFEYFDATSDEFHWTAATVVAAAETGPWRDLTERDSAPLSRREALLARFAGAARVDRELFVLAVNPRRIAFPGDTSQNIADTCALLFAIEVASPKRQEIPIETINLQLSVNGRHAADGKFLLYEGTNFIVGAMREFDGHRSTYELAFAPASGIGRDQIVSQRVVEFPELSRLERDLPFPWANESLRDRHQRYAAIRAEALELRDAAAFLAAFPAARPLGAEECVDDAAHLSFEHRHPRPAAPGDVVDPEYAIYSDDRCAVIHPAPDADIELCYDLGEQNIGFWNFGLFAAAGTVVDIAAVEFITADGKLQHTGAECRNSLRYVCREGYNRYTSFKRRSGRYLFVTIRNRQKTPVRLQFLRLVESTYPVIQDGTFHCSDYRLDRVYDIALRTLKLCMEDTFTDCPLYEQTMWVGDARNESLFAMSSFGAYDLVRRCIRLAGQSLERLPMVGCQVPSGWDCLIPIWSFLWGISVYDYYWESGDLDFCREVWPMVQKNLEGANERIDPETGLFRIAAWNLFDWSRTDCNHETMVQNSLFLVGALDAASKLARVLGADADAELWLSRRAALVEALGRAWDSRKLAWPDSIRETGHCDDISIHTSMLAVLYDAVKPELRPAARANTVSPRPELIPVSSPFASLYLYEALEKLGQPQAIIDTIYKDYLPMLKLGSTTVWETFPHGDNHAAEFPTRSHCHAWSAAPVYYLPRLILGVAVAEPGGRKFKVSPRITGFEFASGSRPTVHGRIDVAWEKRGRELCVSAAVPPGVEIEFETNDTIGDLEVVFSTSVR